MRYDAASQAATGYDSHEPLHSSKHGIGRGCMAEVSVLRLVRIASGESRNADVAHWRVRSPGMGEVTGWNPVVGSRFAEGRGTRRDL